MTLMNVLQVNKYIDIKGGSEVVMDKLSSILTLNGHSVTNVGFISRSNGKLIKDAISLGKERQSVVGMFRNKKLVLKIITLIEKKNIDLVIYHNIYHHFPIEQLLNSIKFIRTTKTVLFLHDYKVVCPIHTLYNYNTGKLCDKCNNKNFFKAIPNKCKDNSYIKSSLLALESYYNNNFYNAYAYVDTIITPSQFLKDKVKELGFGPKVLVLANPVNYKLQKVKQKVNATITITYIGRMSNEKGVEYLLEIAKRAKDIQFAFVGSGNLSDKVIENSKNYSNIVYHGYKTKQELIKIYQKSTFVIVPSLMYEVFGLTIVEAMSFGIPTITTGYGGTKELVSNGRGFEINALNYVEAARQIIEISKISVEAYRSMQDKCMKFVSNLNDDNYYASFISIITDIK